MGQKWWLRGITFVLLTFTFNFIQYIFRKTLRSITLKLVIDAAMFFLYLIQNGGAKQQANCCYFIKMLTHLFPDIPTDVDSPAATLVEMIYL